MEQDRLSPLENDAWSGFVRMHTLLSRELERRLFRSHRMPLSTYEVLLRLAWAAKTGLRMSELAEQVNMTSGGMTRLADRLERDGLITRTRSDEDLRGYQARITPVGRRELRQANRRHLADVRELFIGNLSPHDLETLADIWKRLATANENLGP